MSDTEKLLPCPFCGNKDIRKNRIHYWDISIECDCGAKLQICEEYGEEELIRRWNKRV